MYIHINRIYLLFDSENKFHAQQKLDNTDLNPSSLSSYNVILAKCQLWNISMFSCYKSISAEFKSWEFCDYILLDGYFRGINIDCLFL